MKNYVNWKAFDNSFNSLINKKDIFIQNDYISQNHIVTAKKKKKKKELYLSNYATKFNFKGAKRVDTTEFPKNP